MGLILGDSLVGIAWIVLKLCSSRASYVLQTIWAPWRRHSNGSPSEQTPLLPDSSDPNHPGGAATSAENTDDWPDDSITTPTLVLWLAVALYVTYFACLGTAFREFIPSLATLFAAVLVPLAGFVSMRSLGETDNGAALAVGTFFATLPLFRIQFLLEEHFLTPKHRKDSTTHRQYRGSQLQRPIYACEPFVRRRGRGRRFSSCATHGRLENRVHNLDATKSCLLGLDGGLLLWGSNRDLPL